MTNRLLLALLLLPLACAMGLRTTQAQDSGAAQDSAKDAESPATLLSKALGAKAAERVVLTGKITDRTEQEDGGGMRAMMVIAGRGKKGTKIFGKIEAEVRGREVFVCSQQGMPGAAAMSMGRKVLVQKTEDAEKPVDAGALANDAIYLLDLRRLSKEVARAERRAKEGKKNVIKVKTAEDGTHTIRLPLRSSMLPEPEGGMAGMSMMQPKVMSIDARFVLAADGALRSMRLTVTRSDPMAAIRKRAMQGGGRIEISDPSDLEDDDPEEGAKTEYAFQFGKAKLSKRAARARAYLSSLFLR